MSDNRYRNGGGQYRYFAPYPSSHSKGLKNKNPEEDP
jgi:hypothetical protein